MKLRNKKSISSNNPQETPSTKKTNKSTPSKSQQNGSNNASSGTSRNALGVTKRNSGKYGVKIHDRIRKKDLWLGTFESQEEASEAYWAKKNELEKEFEGLAKNIDKVVKGEKTSKFVGVSLRASGKFAAHIRDPIRKKKLYLGAFDSEEKAAKVYLAKKKELEEEAKGKGVHCSLGRREGKRGTSLLIRKRRNFDEEIQKRRKVGKNGRFSQVNYSDSDQESDMEIAYMDSSDGESASIETGIFEDSSILEVNQSVKEFDSSNDSLNLESGPSNATISEEKTTILEKNPCSDKQESLKEDLAIQKNGAEIEVINIDSIVHPLIVHPSPGRIPGATILLRTISGTPIMDSNGFLLGEFSWIDDMSLSSRM